MRPQGIPQGVRASPTLPTLVLLLATIAPGGLAAAQDEPGDIAIERQLTLTSPASAAVRIVYVYDATNATYFRQLADADGDGAISPAERSANEMPYAEQVRSGAAFGWRVDGLDLVWRSGGTANSRGLEGPVDQAGLLVVTVEGGANLNGTLPEGARHNLTRAATAHEAVAMRETVRAPPGWAFGHAEDPCVATIAAAQRGAVNMTLDRVRGACPAERGNAAVPGAGAVASVGVAAAAGLIARRRR